MKIPFQCPKCNSPLEIIYGNRNKGKLTCVGCKAIFNIEIVLKEQK